MRSGSGSSSCAASTAGVPITSLTRPGSRPRRCRACCAPKGWAGSIVGDRATAEPVAALPTRTTRRTGPRRRQEARRDPRRRRLEDPRTRHATATTAMAESVTGSCTPPSMTAPGSLTPKILDDEQGPTAAAFWHRAHHWFATHGIHIERALTDNGSCYRSRPWAAALASTGVDPQAHPSLPTPDQRQSREVPPDPARGMGLHPPLDLRRPTPTRLRRLHPLLQSPPIPRRTRLGHTHRHPHPTRRGQPPRGAQLARW